MYYGNYGYICKTVRHVIHMQIFLLYFRFVHAYFENLVQLVQGIFNEWNKKNNIDELQSILYFSDRKQ